MKHFALLGLALYAMADIVIRQNEFYIKKPITSWIEIRNKNLVRQKFDYSCGSAALSTILSCYYDNNTSEEQILNAVLDAKGLKGGNESLDGQQNGLSFYDLAEFAKTYGFKAIGVAIDFDELKKVKIPVIVFVKIRKQEHFSTLKKIDERYVYLADPSFGNIRISHSKFEEMFFQREDEKLPGKILAILPSSQRSVKIRQNFMNITPFGSVIYEKIKRP